MRVSLQRSLKNGRSGWLLRWREYERAPGCVTWRRVLLSYWFVDEQEAVLVRDAMRDGANFDEAFRQMWTAIEP